MKPPICRPSCWTRSNGPSRTTRTRGARRPWQLASALGRSRRAAAQPAAGAGRAVRRARAPSARPASPRSYADCRRPAPTRPRPGNGLHRAVACADTPASGALTPSSRWPPRCARLGHRWLVEGEAASSARRTGHVCATRSSLRRWSGVSAAGRCRSTANRRGTLSESSPRRRSSRRCPSRGCARTWRPSSPRTTPASPPAARAEPAPCRFRPSARARRSPAYGDR